MKTKQQVLYYALENCIIPLKDAILENFDEMYNVSKEDAIADKDYNYTLGDILQFASDICSNYEAIKYDVEHTSIVGGIADD